MNHEADGKDGTTSGSASSDDNDSWLDELVGRKSDRKNRKQDGELPIPLKRRSPASLSVGENPLSSPSVEKGGASFLESADTDVKKRDGTESGKPSEPSGLPLALVDEPPEDTIAIRPAAAEEPPPLPAAPAEEPARESAERSARESAEESAGEPAKGPPPLPPRRSEQGAVQDGPDFLLGTAKEMASGSGEQGPASSAVKTPPIRRMEPPREIADLVEDDVPPFLQSGVSAGESKREATKREVDWSEVLDDEIATPAVLKGGKEATPETPSRTAKEKPEDLPEEIVGVDTAGSEKGKDEEPGIAGSGEKAGKTAGKTAEEFSVEAKDESGNEETSLAKPQPEKKDEEPGDDLRSDMSVLPSNRKRGEERGEKESENDERKPEAGKRDASEKSTESKDVTTETGDDLIDDDDSFVSAGADADPWFDDREEAVILPEAVGTTAVPGEAKRKVGWWTIFASLFFAGTLLLVFALVVAVAILWTQRGQIVAAIEEEAVTRLAAEGVFIEYENRGYRFPRGLVIDGLVVFSDATRETPLVTVSDVALNTDLVSLFRHRGAEPLPIQVGFAGSEIRLHDPSGDFALGGLTGDVLYAENRISTDAFRVDLGGMRIELTADMPLPEDKGASPGEGEAVAPEESPGESNAAPLALPLDPALFRQVEEWLAVEAQGVPPRLSISMEMESPGEMPRLEGRLDGRDFVWRGLRFDAAALPFSYDFASDVVQSRGFLASVEGGSVSGSVTLDEGGMNLRVERLESTSNWYAIAKALVPDAVADWGELVFRDNPRAVISGVVNLDDPVGSELTIDYQHREGFVIGRESGPIPFRAIGGELVYGERLLKMDDFALGVFDGEGEVTGELELLEDDFLFDGIFAVESLPLSGIAEFAGVDSKQLDGDLALEFRGSGKRELASWRGSGRLSVEKGQFEQFPLLGAVQSTLSGLVPAFGETGNASLTAAFLLESGYLLANDVLLRAAGTETRGGAQVNLATKEVQFQAAASLTGSLATASGLAGKPIEVRGEGLLGSPEAKLKNIPAELAREDVQAILGMNAESMGTLLESLGLSLDALMPPEPAEQGEDPEAGPSDAEVAEALQAADTGTEEAAEAASPADPAPASPDQPRAAIQSDLGSPVFFDGN